MANALLLDLIIAIVVLLFALITYVFWDKRYRKNHGADIPPGFERTDEVTIDPVDGKRLRVYFNPRTGERFYQEEK